MCSGNDIRQVIHALQMWQHSSTGSTNLTTNITYTNLKDGLGRIEKDKVLRQTPFDACLTILAGPPRTGGSGNNQPGNSSIDERYNSFFIGKLRAFVILN